MIGDNLWQDLGATHRSPVLLPNALLRPTTPTLLIDFSPGEATPIKSTSGARQLWRTPDITACPRRTHRPASWQGSALAFENAAVDKAAVLSGGAIWRVRVCCLTFELTGPLRYVAKGSE